MRRTLRAGAILAAAVGGILALTGAPASAHLNDVSCTVQVADSWMQVACGHPGPALHQYRGWATCTDGSTHYGTWYIVNTNKWSRASCGTNKFVTNWGFDLKS